MFSAPVESKDFDCLDLQIPPPLKATYTRRLDGDFMLRDRLAETDVPKQHWLDPSYGRYGPCPLTFPKVVALEISDPTTWMRKRAVKLAQKYIGLPYKHHHIPAMGGLDCSNFTSWIYNYGFGIRFSSNILRQSEEAGRRLRRGEILKEGDLIFLYNESRSRIVHVAIYVSSNQIIDSSGSRVETRPFSGRYKSNLAWARRVIE